MTGSDGFFLVGRHYLIEGRGSTLVASIWVILLWSYLHVLFVFLESGEYLSFLGDARSSFLQKETSGLSFLGGRPPWGGDMLESYVVGVFEGETLTVSLQIHHPFVVLENEGGGLVKGND